MAFGQPSGPPATASQLRDLTALIGAAGHTSFRDARGPLGLNQRQAGGRFTQDEAVELITRLEAEAEASSAGTDRPAHDRPSPGLATPATPDAPKPPAASRRQSLARQLERVPEDLLVDELTRRGWTVSAPPR
jgi:hypothetical protein